MPDKKILSEANRAKLDGIVQKMVSNKESDETIRFVVDDFKSKYGQNVEDLKKKDLSDGTGQPSQEDASTRTDRSRSLSATERPQGQRASAGLGGDITTRIKSITKKVIDLEEEEAVALLSKEFKGQGFTFEETGAGDAMIVKNKSGETIEIDLDPFFSDTEREEAFKLRKFLSSSKSKEYTEEGAKLFSKPSLTKQEQKRFSNLRSKSKELDLITNQEFDYVDNKESYRNEAKRQVDSEIKGEGIWNTVKQTAKGAWNAYLESPIVEAMSDVFGEEGKRTASFLKADKTLLDKKIREVKSDPKNSKLSNEQVRDEAYKLAIDDRSDKIRQSATTEYISSLPEDQKKSLELDKILELSSIDESAKEKVSKIKILQKSIELDLDKLKEAVSKYGENSNEANSIRNKAKIKIDDIRKLEDSVYRDQDKIGNLEDEVNLLKRNYDGVEGFNAKYTSTVMDMAAGLIEFSGSFTPENSVAETTSEFISSKIKKKADEMRGMYRMPLESVESASDFIDYASDVLASQAPNTILMGLTGTASIPVLLTTSAGQKRIEMRSEMESGGQKYSKAQMILTPLLYGAAEAIPEMNTLNMIRKASRAFKALGADDVARRSLTNSYSKRFIDAGFDNAKDLLKEEGAELFTNTAQNAIDKYILGKENVSIFDNAEDVIKDTAMFSLMLQGAPHVFGAVSKPFSKPEYTEVLKNNASKLIEIEKKLNDPSISESAKKALKFSADKINSQSESIVDKVLLQMESMPIEQREVIVSIEKKQAELKATAESVIKDKTIDSADKKIILKELKSEFKQIEDNRIKILNGEEVQEVTEQQQKPEGGPSVVTEQGTQQKVEIPDWHREEYDSRLREYEEDIADAKKALEEEKAKGFFSRSKSEIKYYEDSVKFNEDRAKLLKENPIEFYKSELKGVKKNHEERLNDDSTYKQDLIDRFGTTDFEVTNSNFIEDTNKKIADYEVVQKTANENAQRKVEELKAEPTKATTEQQQKPEVTKPKTRSGLELARVKDAINNAPVTDRDENNQDLYRFIPFSIIEEANKNDKLGGQTARQIAQRGGYSVLELDNLLPNWKQMLTEQQQSAGQTPVQPTTKVGETIENVEDKNKSLEKIHKDSVLHGTDDGYSVKQSEKSYETAKDIRTQVAKLTKGNLGEIVEFKTDGKDGTILYNVAVAVSDSKRGGGRGFIAYSVKVEKESNLSDSEIYSVLRKNLDGVFEQGLVNNQGIISKGVNLNQINKKTFEPTKQQQKPDKEIVVYHSTQNDFDEFRVIGKNDGKTESQYTELGIHLGTEEQAKKRAETKGIPKEKQKILKLKINPKNIVRVDDKSRWTLSTYKNILLDLGLIESKKKVESFEDVLKILKENNIDAFVYNNKFEGEGDSYVVFDNKNISYIDKDTEQQQKPEGKNSLSLFQEISEMTSKSQMQEFSKNNPEVAFIHNNIEGIIKGIDGAKVVEC